MARWEKICPLGEVPPGGRKLLQQGLWDVLIVNAGGRVFAVSAECPHLGVSLHDGEVTGSILRCNGHGYKLDLSNGRCLSEAGLSLATFPTEIREGWIWIEI